MAIHQEISFKDILEIVETLPPSKIRQLQSAITRHVCLNERQQKLKALLLKGPVATSRQLETIAHNRKAINQWRHH